MIRHLMDNENSSAPPRMALSHSFWALGQLPEPPIHYVKQLRDYGFECIEVGLRPNHIELARQFKDEFGLRIVGQGWAQNLEEAKPFIAGAAHLDALAINLHLGHAYLAPEEAADLANHCHELAHSAGLLLVVETHRGRMTQDLHRTAEWIRLAPEISINLDVSHFIVAGEGFGGSEELFLQHLEPIIERTCMIHARIGDGECVQSDIGISGEADCVDRFFEIWVRVMQRWRKNAQAGDVFIFEPELGPPPYAQTDLNGKQISDRWQQSLVMAEIGKRVWNVSDIGRE